MNQQMSQGPNPTSSGEAPAKRKRGRPRKDDNQANQVAEKISPVVNQPLRPMITRMMAGEGSGAIKSTPSTAPPPKGKDQIEVGIDLESRDDNHNNDQMIGQVVTGVLERAFDAGYLLRIRVGDTNVHMRGVVFKEGCVVPITPENDIAPNAKMYTRTDIPIPVTFAPEVPRSLAGVSSSKPVETFSDQQRQQLPVIVTTLLKDNQPSFPMNAEPEKLVSSENPIIVNERVSEHKELSEPERRLQQTDQVYSYGLIPNNVNSDDVHSQEGAIESAVIIERPTIPPESEPVVKDQDPVEPEIGDVSNFQISMENTDNDEPDPLPEVEPNNEVSAMQIE